MINIIFLLILANLLFACAFFWKKERFENGEETIEDVFNELQMEESNITMENKLKVIEGEGDEEIKIGKGITGRVKAVERALKNYTDFLEALNERMEKTQVFLEKMEEEMQSVNKFLKKTF